MADKLYKSVEELKSDQLQHIVNKLQLRTALMREAVPAPKADNRDPWLVEYERDYFDNPKSPACGNFDMAVMASILAGKKFDAKDFNLNQTVASPLPFERGVALVTIDSKLYTWDVERNGIAAGTTLVCTGEVPAGSREGYKLNTPALAGTFRFRTQDFNTVKLPALTTANARYATDAEIKAWVDAAAATAPATLIKLLGDADEFVKSQN